MRKQVEYITSRQNALLVLLQKLSDRKHRYREGLFRFDGWKLLEEALRADVPLYAVLLCESEKDAICEKTGLFESETDARIVVLPDDLFGRVSEEKSPEGVICIAKHLDKIHKIVTINKGVNQNVLPFEGNALLLESVRDPGNLGTVIRSAKAFGISELIVSADCADIYHPRTIRAAMGTLFTQHITVAEDAVALAAALGKQRRVFAAALEPSAEQLGRVALRPDDVIVVGNEGHGLSAAMREACTHSIYIPMAKGVESLNAGIAASLLLWELYRGV